MFVFISCLHVNSFPGIVSDESPSRSSCTSSDGAANSWKKTTYISSRVLHQDSQRSTETLFARVFTWLLHWRGRVRAIFVFSHDVKGAILETATPIIRKLNSFLMQTCSLVLAKVKKRNKTKQKTNKQTRKLTRKLGIKRANQSQITIVKQDYEAGV